MLVRSDSTAIPFSLSCVWALTPLANPFSAVLATVATGSVPVSVLPSHRGIQLSWIGSQGPAFTVVVRLWLP